MPSPASSRSRSAKAVGLGVVEAGRRLVEQQHPGPGGERPAELDEAGEAGGHGVDPVVGDARMPTRSRTPRPRAAGRPGRRRRPRAVDLGGGEDVLARGQRAEDLEALEGAGDAAAGPLVRRQAVDVLAVEEHAGPWPPAAR